MAIVPGLITAYALIHNIRTPKKIANCPPEKRLLGIEEEVNEIARQMDVKDNISVVKGPLHSLGTGVLGSGAMLYPDSKCDPQENIVHVRKQLTHIKNNDYLINPLIVAAVYFAASTTPKGGLKLAFENEGLYKIARLRAAPCALAYLTYRVSAYISDYRAIENALSLSDEREILRYRRDFEDLLEIKNDYVNDYKIDEITKMYRKGKDWAYSSFYPPSLEARIEHIDQHLANRKSNP
jgi:hypothetical protein